MAGWLADGGVSGLKERMHKLVLDYQEERPNVEVADLTTLVIQALALLVSKQVAKNGDVGDADDVGDVRRIRRFILTAAITDAAQSLLESLELDINPDSVTSRRIAKVLKKMRFTNSREGRGGKRGWIISLDEVERWAASYGMEPNQTPGLNIVPHYINVTHVTNVTTPLPLNPWHGEF